MMQNKASSRGTHGASWHRTLHLHMKCRLGAHTRLIGGMTVSEWEVHTAPTLAKPGTVHRSWAHWPFDFQWDPSRLGPLAI
jgi:hypothetical protein